MRGVFRGLGCVFVVENKVKGVSGKEIRLGNLNRNSDVVVW